MIVPASGSYSSVLVSKLIPMGSALNKASEIDTNSATYSRLRRLIASRCSEGLMRCTIARHGPRLRRAKRVPNGKKINQINGSSQPSKLMTRVRFPSPTQMFQMLMWCLKMIGLLMVMPPSAPALRLLARRAPKWILHAEAAQSARALDALLPSIEGRPPFYHAGVTLSLDSVADRSRWRRL
jgi:hypothetical protein